MDSIPLRVNVTLRGQLPDTGCTTIASVEQIRNENVIDLNLVTTTDPLALCAQALTPFEHIVPLDVINLTPGKYTVNAQGIEQVFVLPTRDVSQFKQMLVDALTTRDYEMLKSLMDESFLIGYWQSEGTSNTHDEAIEMLQGHFPGASSSIIPDPNKDLVALLGADPVTIIGTKSLKPAHATPRMIYPIVIIPRRIGIQPLPYQRLILPLQKMIFGRMVSIWKLALVLPYRSTPL